MARKEFTIHFATINTKDSLKSTEWSEHLQYKNRRLLKGLEILDF